MPEQCQHYRILSDDAAHEHCLPDIETLNVGTRVQCTAPRLQNGLMKSCDAQFIVSTKGLFNPRKVWESPYYYGGL